MKNYPTVTLNSRKHQLYTTDKTGDLSNSYSPLQNLITDSGVGDFTTQNLNLDRYTPVDIIVTDEYDGSENLIINDDKNAPRLINSGMSVLEDHTFLLPQHMGNAVTNRYDDSTLDLDINLLKLYNTIPKLVFDGLRNGGLFKCGSYVFYFKLADADGNLTNIVLESSIVLIHIGSVDSKKIRMGQLDEVADKSVKFTLSNIDSGFDYVRIFYERSTSGESQAMVHSYYMINLNFPIINKKCSITLTGQEETIQISKAEILNEFADIQSAKTQTVVLNTLFLGNTTAYAQEFAALLKLAWRIIPEEVKGDLSLGGIDQDYNQQTSGGRGAYQNILNVYNYTGYWPDEYYRFGVVFIYDNNLLSPAFNILGVDFNLLDDSNWYYKYYNDSEDFEYWDSEPENYIFKNKFLSNSKGVIHFSKGRNFHVQKNILQPKPLGIKFDLRHIKEDGLSIVETLRKYHIKGLFFTRLKRIPTVLAQGLVIGQLDKDHGALPVLKKDNNYITKSFLSSFRMLETEGTTITTYLPSGKALLVPDFELQEATFNQIFTGQEFLLTRLCHLSFEWNRDHSYLGEIKEEGGSQTICKLTTVPRNTKTLTDGDAYFSTLAGDPHEPYKTKDVLKIWDKTAPQYLSESTSLVRGEWGSYVGTNTNKFAYGDLVNIKLSKFNDPEQNLLEFLDRFNDKSLYSAISERRNVSDLKASSVTCYRGDCFISLFTHRMMNNFADPELPTNTEIVSPACWAENYAVRCTALPNYQPKYNVQPEDLGWVVDTPQDTYANEVVQAFEFLEKRQKGKSSEEYRIVTPDQQEKDSKNVLKMIFKSEGELRGLSAINRADVNAVSFGQWITFPVCSALNLNLRDIDFSEATEEAAFNKKRSFYPLEDMNIFNHLPESRMINAATKKSISDNQLVGFTSVPFIKQEYFNRIYFSRPNVAQEFINSYRMIFANQYKEYNKEFGSITKLLELGNSLMVVFDHGIGLLPVNRTPLSDIERSPYLPMISVLPQELSVMTSDYGSMWKDSIIRIPDSPIVYGVDTVARKIWRTTGEKLEFISDFNVEKFLNDEINLSEYDFEEYQGHVNVKTHYNNFKHDVIFTFYKDIPIKNEKGEITSWEKGKTWTLCYNHSISKFVTFYDWYPVESCNVDNIFFSFDKELLDTVYNKEDDTVTECFLKYTYDPVTIMDSLATDILEYHANNNSTFVFSMEFGPIDPQYPQRRLLFVTDPIPTIVDGSVGIAHDILNFDLNFFETEPYKSKYQWLIDHLKDVCATVESPTTSSAHMRYNLTAFFGKTRRSIWPVTGDYSNRGIDTVFIDYNLFTKINKKLIDPAFNDSIKLYNFSDNKTIRIVAPKDGYLCFYAKDITVSDFLLFSEGLEDEYIFYYKQVSKDDIIIIEVNPDSYIADIKVTTKEDIPDINGLKHYNLRNSSWNHMDLWKHGMAGLYDNQGEIKPTHWYGQQHEFNFEFVVNDTPLIQKIFNNLKIVSNKTAPNKFEYEVVGEGYEWFEYKPIIKWINDQEIPQGESGDYWWILVLTNCSTIANMNTFRNTHPDFPKFNRAIKKLPYLKMVVTDRKGRADRSYWSEYQQPSDGHYDYWVDDREPTTTIDNKYKLNSNETVLTWDKQLNENRVHTESLGNDMKKYGRIRGNMEYLEDLWDIEIRPVTIKWCYIPSNSLSLAFKDTETRHRDKYIKIKVRYSGEDLAVIQLIITMFEYSFA